MKKKTEITKEDTLKEILKCLEKLLEVQCIRASHETGTTITIGGK